MIVRVFFLISCLCLFPCCVQAQETPAVSENSELELAATSHRKSVIPYKKDFSVPDRSIFIILSLVILLITASVVLYYLKKNKLISIKGASGNDDILIVETKRLSTKSIAYLLKVKDSDILLVQSDTSINMICLGEDQSSDNV